MDQIFLKKKKYVTDKIRSTLYILKVQIVYKTLLNIQTPNYKITNLSFMSNTKCAENEHKL